MADNELVRSFSIRNPGFEFKLNCINEAKQLTEKCSFKKVSNNPINLERLKKYIFHRGALIERAHYCAILVERGRTNRGGCFNRGSTVLLLI